MMGKAKVKTTASLMRKKLLSSSRPRLSPRRTVRPTEARTGADGWVRAMPSAGGSGVVVVRSGSDHLQVHVFERRSVDGQLRDLATEARRASAATTAVGWSVRIRSMPSGPR